MKYCLITYGCQMNISDSERLAGVLEKSDYQKTDDPQKADLIVIVSCSVRQMAIDRVYGTIRNIRRNNKKAKIIVSGCLPLADKQKLKKQAELVFDIKDLNKIQFNNLTIRQDNKKTSNYLEIKPKHSTFPIGYVPIITGCNNFCSYCVVPYTRGREISRKTTKIVQEVKDLINEGYKEVVLLGQNVNSYQSKNVNFPRLLKTIDNLSGNFWLTFLSSHPKDFSDELVKVIAKGKKIMPYIHLPVQAGDDQILKKMNRHYTICHYKNIINKVRNKIKILTLSTDIIVGFPGETKKQFEQTAKLMRQMKFDMAYLAKYSPRPGTAAWQLPDNVPTQEKEKRWKTLNIILKKTSLENNKKNLGGIIEVLIIENKESYFLGQSKGFKNVKVNRESTQIEPRIPQIGDIVKVKINKAISWGLEGVITR